MNKFAKGKRIRNVKTQAIIFDMDGVITDTMPYHFRVWKQVFQSQGIIVTKEDIYTREGQKGIESIREIYALHGKRFDIEHAQKLLADKEVLFKKTFKRRFIAGSRKLIKSLSAEGFKLALVTGTSRDEVTKLLPSEIFNVFHVTVCGSDVKKGKPHPEPYLRALKELAIDPRQAIVIENAPFGIRSAKLAGLRCIAIATSLPKQYLNEADHVFASIQALRQEIVFV